MKLLLRRHSDILGPDPCCSYDNVPVGGVRLVSSDTGLGTLTPSRSQRRRVLIVFVCLVVAVVLIVGNVTPAQLLRAQTVEPVPLRTIPNTDVNPYGANFFLHWEPEQWKVEKTLQMASEAGLGWVKQQFPWEDIELKKGSFWDDRMKKSTWDKYDNIVQMAQKYNMKIIARLDRPPTWARQDNTQHEAPPDNLQDYADFVEAVARRYRGRISYYQIWNEPNIFPEWGNRPINPKEYVDLLRVGYEAVKRADPSAYVLSAPLAQTTENSRRAMADVDFLTEMYKQGAANYFDILFANAYGFSLPPDDPPNPNVLNFQRVQLLHNIMVAYGDGNKPVWFNEFGWDAPPSDFPPDKLIWGRVDEQQQAEYTISAVKMARKQWPWAGVFCVWYFRQDGHILPDRADYYFRMVDVGFTPRPLYNAVKANAAALAQEPAPPGDYQETNPGLKSEGKWQILQDQRASGGAALVSSTPGDNVTITFRGTSLSLLLRKGPAGGTLFVTVDGQGANNLPKDSQGRSYIDLYNPSEQWQTEVTVASDLPDREHRARLVVAQSQGSMSGGVATFGSSVVIDGFSVRLDAVPVWQNLVPVVAALVLGLLAVIWWRRRPRFPRTSKVSLQGSE